MLLHEQHSMFAKPLEHVALQCMPRPCIRVWWIIDSEIFKTVQVLSGAKARSDGLGHLEACELCDSDLMQLYE
jgi:hypothetical protein